MQKPTDMSGKVVLVTGAASGVGRAVALKLAQAGAAVGLVDIAPEGLAQVAEEIREHGSNGLVQVADLAESGNCAAVVEATVAEFGRLDALCNIAAVMVPCHTAEMPHDAFEKTLAVNLAAPFYLIQAAVPHLLASSGAIVNVASAVGITAQAYNAAYCATKAGLIHMTKSLAMEFINTSIRINAVAPGGMMTPLVRNMLALNDTDPTLMARCAPLRGLVEIDEVANAIAFLASPAAQGYHGSCIVIDKGMCAG